MTLFQAKWYSFLYELVQDAGSSYVLYSDAIAKYFQSLGD